jgi:hypothetical protein
VAVPEQNAVFVNVPFDRSYESLFVTLCDGMVACLLDTFVADVPNAAAEFRSAARVLRRSAALLKRQMKTTSLFRPALFRLVGAAAADIARDRSFIKP